MFRQSLRASYPYAHGFTVFLNYHIEDPTPDHSTFCKTQQLTSSASSYFRTLGGALVTVQ